MNLAWQDAPSFPADFSSLRAYIEFTCLEPGRRYDIAGMAVTAMRQRHPGDSYGFRFESDGRSVVYTTDSEHKLEDPAQTAAFVEFFRDADVVIFDAMYSLAETTSAKADWGHSSNIVGVELCQLAGVRQLCLFHHEPTSDDETISRVLADTRRLEEITRGAAPLRIRAAYDGMPGGGHHRRLDHRLPARSGEGPVVPSDLSALAPQHPDRTGRD